MSGGREPNVVVNVNTAQNRQLRSAGDTVGLRIRLLGPVAIANDGKPVAIASKKARGLIGYLALRQGTEISRGVLPAFCGASAAKARRAQACARRFRSFAAPFPAARSRLSRQGDCQPGSPGSAWIDAHGVGVCC